MKQLVSDIAIIGGGPAGVTAAISAAEKNASVIIIEKTDHTGGASNGGMGMFAVESRLQIQKNHKFSREDAFNFFMEFTHWRADARLIRAYIDKSADTIDWLEKRGVSFVEPIAYYPGAQFTWHLKDMKSPPIMQILQNLAGRLGVRTLTETPAEKILIDGGRVSGVVAADKSGEEVRVMAKAVIIATGGFGDNPDMIKRHTGMDWGKNLFSMRVPGLTGDGLRMAWEAGAADTEMFMDVYSCLPPPYGGPGGTSFDLTPFRQPVLMVNQSGERFCNEEVAQNVAMAANAIRRQKNGCAVRIFDEETRAYQEDYDKKMIPAGFGSENPLGLTDVIKKALAEGYQHLFMADSIEELGKQAGIDPNALQKTINEYNNACETGRDELFFKKAKFLRAVSHTPFYAARFFCGGYGSLGGIKINHKTEVLNKEYEVIPGLYSAGTDANAIYGDTYPFALSGNTSGFAYNTGRIAGENASAYIKSTN